MGKAQRCSAGSDSGWFAGVEAVTGLGLAAPPRRACAVNRRLLRLPDLYKQTFAQLR